MSFRSLTRTLGFTGLALGLLSVIPAVRTMSGKEAARPSEKTPARATDEPTRPAAPVPADDLPAEMARHGISSGMYGKQGNLGGNFGFNGNFGGFSGNFGGFSGNSGGFSGNFGLSGNSGGFSGNSGNAIGFRPGGFNGRVRVLPQFGIGGQDLTFTGIQGVYGIQGGQQQGFSTQGFFGNSGQMGFTGQSGFSGQMGFQGFQGQMGFQGFQGFQGQMGFQGFQGQMGFQGFNGMVGKQFGFAGALGM